MDMQEKRPSPANRGEDASIPWPNADLKRIELKPMTPLENMMNSGASQENQSGDAVQWGCAGNTGCPESPENNKPHIPNDSIDPRLLAPAMGFVPRQAWEEPYEFEMALRRGTVFPSLDKPFLGEEAIPR